MATLKISDLSVGDWVRYDNGVTPYSIRSIVRTGDQECVVLSDDMYPDGITGFVKYLKPIPITPEILEANGWKKGQRGEFYHYLQLDKNSTLYVHASTNGWRVEITYDAAGILRTTHLMPDVVSVHQLQHILRLAGVDKEIVMPNK